MADKLQLHMLPTLITGEDGRTRWAQRQWPAHTRGGMRLSPQIACSSLRLRQSDPGYATGWHVAGDPTLIIVQSGTLKLILRDGPPRLFGPGQAFIAADHVPDSQTFNDALHGHRAEVVGDNALEAIHIKLLKLRDQGLGVG